MIIKFNEETGYYSVEELTRAEIATLVMNAHVGSKAQSEQADKAVTVHDGWLSDASKRWQHVCNWQFKVCAELFEMAQTTIRLRKADSTRRV